MEKYHANMFLARGHSLEEIAEVFDGPSAIPDTKEMEGKLSKSNYEERIEDRAS